MKWIAICNGGPNGKTVGCHAKSLGKIFGRAEAMCTALNATYCEIAREDCTTTHEVETEGANR